MALNSSPASSPASDLSTDELVKRVVESGLRAEYSDAVELVGRGEEAVQYLSKYVREDAYWWGEDDNEPVGGWYAPISALHLLGAIGSIGGLEDVLYAIYERSKELDDWLTEEMASILASFGSKALPRLKECATDRRKLDLFARDTCVRAMAMIARRESSVRDGVLEFIRSLVERKPESREFIANTVWTLAELKNHSALPVIREAYRRNRVEESIITLDDVLDIYGSRDESGFEYHHDEKNPLDYFKKENLQDLMKAQEEWRSSRRREEDEGLNIFERGERRTKEIAKPPGRNEPCTCGSGRKYKKCCLPLQLERKRWDPLEDRLRALVDEFKDEERFEEELKRAVSLFGIDRSEADISEQRLFFDWYIHDYIIPGEGQSIIRLFERERSRKLASDEERRTISSWASSSFRFLEVLEIKRGTGYRVRDSFEGSEYFVWDASSSHSLSRYDVLFVRPYSVGRITRLAGGVMMLPRGLKARVDEYIKAGYEKYSAVTGSGKGIGDYFKIESLSILKYLRTALTASQPLLTSEGDMLIFSSCEYTLSDFHRVKQLLDSCRDLRRVGEERGALRYDLVEIPGESSEHEEPGDDGSGRPSRYGDALRLQTFLSTEEGESGLSVLANLSLKGKKLGVSCTSDKRLQSCKALIERVLGKLIVGRSEDRYVEPSSLLGAGRERGVGVSAAEDHDADEGLPPEVERRVAEKFFEEYYTKWLRMKIPALGGMTPLEASKTAEGRKELEEMLKVMENAVERSEGKVRPPIKKLRATLGL